MTEQAMTIRTRTPDDETVIVELTVALSVAAAFRAFTDPDELARWYWPPRLAADYSGAAAEPGDALRVRSDVIDLGYTATVREVVANERLVLDWQWDGDANITEVLVEFAAGDGTDVRVTHMKNNTVEMRDAHLTGWTDCLTRLGDYEPG